MKGTTSETLTARVLNGMAEVPQAIWDGLANPPGQPFNPFVSHAFLLALEQSGSATARTGWKPCHLLLEDRSGRALGAMPCYLKSHSRGEYVFDWGWAEAIERVGGRYYPKLQAAVPFTPVTGPRLLVPPGEMADRHRKLLAEASRELAGQAGASSVHITFISARRMVTFRRRIVAETHRYAVPLAQSRLWQLRGLPQRPVVAEAQEHPQGARHRRQERPRHPLAHRRRSQGSALGRLLPLLH